jgi:putative tryptophan/tyrosine transport system substrate-binding protein
MRRREFITFLGGAAANWPLVVSAQQAERIRRIGLLMTIAENEPEAQARLAAFRTGLRETGWVEGRNIQIDYRFAAGEPERVQSAAKDLVKLAPDVVLANGRAILAALKEATTTIPIVFVLVPDPVGDGFVASLARPGGNLTGITNFEFEMGGKWLGLLKEIAPRVSRVLLIFNPETAPYAHFFLESVKLGAEANLAPVRNDKEIERTFTEIRNKETTGVIVMPDLFTSGHRATIVAQAATIQVPTIYPFGFFATNGGLLSYGVDTLDLFRRSASYVDRIFKGDKPSDLPVQAPTKFELVINLKTAKALGLEVPPSLLARADEVIE